MFSLLSLLAACLATATLTAAICFWLFRKRLADVRIEESIRHASAERRLQAEHARALRELQHSLVADVEQLRERSRRPIKSFVGSLLG